MKKPPTTTPLNKLIIFCYGKEDRPDEIGAVARFVRAHASHEYPGCDPSRWSDINDLKTHPRHIGPNVTAAQIDAAMAATS